MDNLKLRALIASFPGAHQKAIQTLLSAIPQIKEIETVSSTRLALEQVITNPPDLLVTGANIPEDQVIELVQNWKTRTKSPYCIVVTLSESSNCLVQQAGADLILSTKSFARQLPEVLNQAFAQ
jgi:DNA-binding NarL/FixJ family response regulator